jgi:Hemerythrin HHE cation binding domain
VAKRNRTGRNTTKSARSAKGPRKTTAARGGARKTAAKRGPSRTTARKGAVKKGATKTARRKTAARVVAARTTNRSQETRPAKSTSLVTAAAEKVGVTLAKAVQRVVGSLPWSGDANDPIALLETDHRRFEDLLKQGEDTTERAVSGRTNLLDTLTAELNVHELIEEKVLYPALKPHAEARDIVLEGFEEHHVADILVRELHQLTADNERWGAKFKVLKESIEHHIEEEESKMFPSARQVLTREELQELGARMRTMKKEAEADSE